MGLKFKQLRFYNYNAATSLNEPHISTVEDGLLKWRNGNAFTEYLPVSRLGIQAPPGTRFYLNGSETPIKIGWTGLFELDLSQGGEITSIQFDIGSLNFINGNSNACILLDLVYIG